MYISLLQRNVLYTATVLLINVLFRRDVLYIATAVLIITISVLPRDIPSRCNSSPVYYYSLRRKLFLFFLFFFFFFFISSSSSFFFLLLLLICLRCNSLVYFLISFLQLYPLGFLNDRKIGLFSPGKASSDRVALPNLRYVLGVWMFPNPPNSDMDDRIFNVRIDVNACDCTRGVDGQT